MKSTENMEGFAWGHSLTATTFLLAVLFALSGCDGHKGRQASSEGAVAELQGDLNLARKKYAEACVFENGEAFRKLAELSLRCDTEILLQGARKDEAWIDASRQYAQKIANVGREAARRGFPVENLEERLAAFDASLVKALEESREAERMALEAERLKEEQRREAERLAEEQRRQEAVARLREEESRLEREIRATENGIEECSQKIAKYSDEDNQRELFMYAMMNGEINSEDDARRLGEGVRQAIMNNEERKNDLEKNLAALRRQLADVRRKIASPTDSVAAGAVKENADARREALVQSIFTDMGGDALVEASDRVMNAQQEALRQVFGRLTGQRIDSSSIQNHESEEKAAARAREQAEHEEAEKRERQARKEAEEAARRARLAQEEEAARKELETARTALAGKKLDAATEAIQKALAVAPHSDKIKGLAQEMEMAVAREKQREEAARREAERQKQIERAARIKAKWAAIRDAFAQGGEKAGETKKLPLPGGNYMELVWCPPGNFTMGSPGGMFRGEEGRSDSETQHPVTLSQGFWMAKTEVTQAQWRSVMGDNPSAHKGDQLPVENVSWDECLEFCGKIEKFSGGLSLRLPTEAEWEYACRAGSGGPYSGTEALSSMGWYQANSGNTPHTVGEKAANGWELYDMHGNVGEWCADWIGEYSGTSTDPIGAASGFRRVVRGGDYLCAAQSCRSAARYSFAPYGGYTSTGFRPVISQTRHDSIRQATASQQKEEVVLAPHKTTSPAKNAEGKNSHAPGDEKTIVLPGGAEMVLVWCPPGSFMMGSPKNELGRKQETLHGVTIPEGFWMAKYEVTQKQWRSVMGDVGHETKQDDLPMSSTSWRACQEFCRKAQNGLHLPTEVQWEYACRAGCQGPYAGTGRLADMGWYDSGWTSEEPHPGGQKQPNAWGLYDMHGNVWEWCADEFGPYPGEWMPAPILERQAGKRNMRGGSVRSKEASCRSATRCMAGNERDAQNYTGLRPITYE